MATPMAEIIANYAMVIIDDIRLREQAQINPALYLRRMSLYMDSAIPLFSRPPEVRTYLQNGLVKPTFADAVWISTEASKSEVTVVPVEAHYEYFSCTKVIFDDAGEASYVLYPDCQYDSENGTVTFPEQSESGVTFTMDFYTDGYFAHDLTETQKRILGFCIAYIWYQRFTTDWLNMQPKIRDKSFEVGPEHAHITANTGRLREIRMQLSEEMKKYEQDCAYYDKIKGAARNTTLL